MHNLYSASDFFVYQISWPKYIRFAHQIICISDILTAIYKIRTIFYSISDYLYIRYLEHNIRFAQGSRSAVQHFGFSLKLICQFVWDFRFIWDQIPFVILRHWSLDIYDIDHLCHSSAIITDVEWSECQLKAVEYEKD